MKMEAEKPKQSIEKICDQALSIVKKYISKEPETVIGVEETEEEWKVTVEALERKAVPDTQDLLGRYEIRLNKEGELLGWKQKMVRKRADRMVPAEEEWVITT
jgi:hypothetical protein